MRSALLDRPTPEQPLDVWFVEGLRPAGRGVRPEVCPPQAAAPRPWAQTLREWLSRGWSGQRPATTATPVPLRTAPALETVRQDFIDAVDGIPPAASDALLDRIHFARSLRELWHLRAELFRLVALHHSQAEADERLSWLNRHFPTRAPRSGFAPLNPIPSKDMWP
jgi:hypothetical protein